jgi:hypothetical protein
MSRTVKIVLLTLLLLLDVLVVSPWLTTRLPAPPGVERAFGFLIPLAAGLIGSMLSKKKKKPEETASSGGAGALNELLNFQKQRLQATEPLQQASLAMASGMMPTYMKQPGGGIDQWTQKYNANALPGLGTAVPRAGAVDYGTVDPRALTSAMLQGRLKQPPYMT